VNKLAEWWKIADPMIQQGIDYATIADKCGVSWQSVNNRAYQLRTQTKTGKDEIKPKYNKIGNNYHIYSERSNQDVIISEDELRRFKKLYCGQNSLTINGISRELKLTRQQIYLIKTAFGITHDDIPYIDEDLQNRDTEELVDETLIEKKDKYFKRLQEKEIEQAYKELEEYRKQEYFIDKIRRIIQDGMKEFAAGYDGPVIPLRQPEKTGKMAEISIADLHLGKLAWKPETGENYDHKIAEKRFMSVIYDFVERNKYKLEKIVFVVGNDFFNYDTIEGTTTAGTRQDNDVRWQKLFVKGAELLVKAIDILSKIAPVEVIFVPGNHSKMAEFYAVNYIDAWFRNDDNVKVNTDPRTRKYIEFGKCLIGFTHGDKEKKRIFGNMQVEVPEMWGRTKYREWHCGHYHSEQVKEEHGVIVRNLSSITGTDAWHYESGYVGAIAKSQSFIWDKEKGLIEILITTID